MPYKDPEKQKQAQRRSYEKNIEKARNRRRNRRKILRDYVDDYKKANCCSECGFDHYVALEFHHRDPTQKDLSISEAIVYNWPLRKLIAEIKKCDIVCSNCHKLIHWINNCPVKAGKTRAWLKQKKKDARCIQCGCDDPSCIVFHHRNPDEKLFELSTAARGGYTVEELELEFEKCDAMCSNCHLILHSKLDNRY